MVGPCGFSDRNGHAAPLTEYNNMDKEMTSNRGAAGAETDP